MTQIDCRRSLRDTLWLAPRASGPHRHVLVVQALSALAARLADLRVDVELAPPAGNEIRRTRNKS
jgi:hypothetical protein